MSEGGGLEPPQRVLQGGRGSPYFRVTRGIIEANRSRGGGGVIQHKYDEEEYGGKMMNIMVRFIVIIPRNSPLPSHNLRENQMLKIT